MKRFYRAAIVKRAVGSAIEFVDPRLQGKVVLTVTDSTTDGDNKIFLVDASEEQHEANVALPGVQALAEKDAVELARRYQPERTLVRRNPFTGKDEKKTIHAVDVTGLLR